MSNRIEKTKSILVIDNEPMVLQLLKIVLESEGYDVRLAADGIFGMALYREKKPDLVLLDLMVPDPNGFQILQSIRQDGNIPVIMVTGKCDVDSLQQTLALGADDSVRKPFRPRELMARVRSKLRRVEMRVS